MPAVKSAKRSSAPNIRSPVQLWLAHLKISTLSESHNLLQHSSMIRNKAKYSIIHITRNLLRVLITGNKNYCKLAGKLNTILLLGSGSDAYEELTRMQKIVQECHDYFVEYMRHYVPLHVQSNLECTVLSMDKAISSIGDSSDYVDVQNRKLFSFDVEDFLKSHHRIIEDVKNLFVIMATETYKVILTFMENCASDLLNETIMREVMRHLSTISHAEFVAKCLRMAEAIPLFVKHQDELFYQALLQLCRVDSSCCNLLSNHIAEFSRVADETKQEDVRSCALEIIGFIVTRAAKSLNNQKPTNKGPSNGLNKGVTFSVSLYAALPAIATMATKQLYRVASLNSTMVYHSTLRIICGVWRITTRMGKPQNEIEMILSRGVESLIAKLDAFEDKDPKSRHLTMMVIAMLARSRLCQQKLEKAFVLKRLLEILDDTFRLYTKLSSGSQSSGSGDIEDSEATRSTSCESLIRNVSNPLKSKKRVTFASDCTLTSSRSKVYDLASTLANPKGSLPNLSSPSLSLKSVLTNGKKSNGICRSSIVEDQSQFHQQILHNCAFALTRICTKNSFHFFRENDGPEVVSRIMKDEKSSKPILPYLIRLQEIGAEEKSKHSDRTIEKHVAISPPIADLPHPECPNIKVVS